MTSQRGFTLIELAIVLVIITILIGGLAVPLSAQIQARRIAETQWTLEEAKEAVIGYARTHPVGAAGYRYLPCPDIDGNGTEDRAGNACAGVLGAIATGFLPWVDLGVAPYDAWGNRLRYAVIATFADKGTGFSASTSLPLPDPLWVCATYLCASPDVAANVGFVLVSHGPNGWGAKNVNGNTLAAPSGLDEADNLNSNRTYIIRSPTQPGSASGEFDDLMTWVSFSQLVPRVCPTGCAP